jgi:hypothetical protein
MNKMSLSTAEKLGKCGSNAECQAIADTIKSACSQAAVQLPDCMLNLNEVLLISANVKLDLLATGGLIALALGLNLAYLNLAALRFPEKLRKFINRILEDESLRERLVWLVNDSLTDTDRKVGAIICRLADSVHLSGINKTTVHGLLPKDEATFLSKSVLTRAFYRFGFNRRSEASPVPTMDKVLCAICGIACVALLFRDTATMMSIIIPNWFWAILTVIPTIFVLLPIMKESKRTGLVIICTISIFA